MLPRKLTLSGFLSYRSPVTIDFTPITLACISGANGAGKSSLLDAITWALFGQARQRGDAIIHSQAQAAEVTLDFAYEGNVYRVRRRRERAKSTVLEFHIQTAAPAEGQSAQWKALTESSVRETQNRIIETLRVDYDTFVHASFFLQGEADKFSRERPGKRKEILARILGLQQWETYRQRAAERRRATEAEIQSIDARMAEMRAEIQHETELQTSLSETEADIARLEEMAAAQEALLREQTRLQATLERQRALTDELARQIAQLEARQTDLTARLAERQSELERHQALLAREDAIRAAYARWQQAREALQKLDELSTQFHHIDAERQPLLQAIAAEEAQLQQALRTLQAQAQRAENARQTLQTLETRLTEAQAQADRAARAVSAAEEAQKRLAALGEQLGQLAAQRDQLAQEGSDYRERVERLQALEASECPLCGQPLTAAHRERILAQWEATITDLRAQYQSINEKIGALRAEHEAAQKQAARLPQLRREHQAALQALTRLQAQRDTLTNELASWEAEGAPQLEALAQRLQKQDFAHEARAKLQALDDHLRELGYDPDAHAAARQREAELRRAEDDLRALESARAAFQPLQREAEELARQIKDVEAQLPPLREQHQRALQELAEAEQNAPDADAAERRLTDLRERIAELHKVRGGVQQQLHTIAKFKQRLETLTDQREALARTVGHYKTLEEAFGKNGVPALLIEQTLPLLEEEANRLLERLTDGRMSVHFRTQRPYKDGKRADMKETLDIIISDEYGQRDYESYSGGEAFRVDFAIRVALARMLARRAGARLQTLVIDEGFGSQDATGRQRLVEAIRTVQEDFAKILVITHLDELKEAFPARIEATKTPEGSRVDVVLA